MSLTEAPVLTAEQLEEYHSRGYLVVKDFISSETADRLRAECGEIIRTADFDSHRAHTFSCSEDQGEKKDDYFLSSVDKVRFFFEESAFDANGKLIVAREHSLNKIAHGLHRECAGFREVTFNEKSKSLLRQLGFESPKVVQSMYICKSSLIGEKVNPHQDETFLWSEPDTNLLGFWLALEDANIENGCLQFEPGSHKKGLVNGRRWIRNPDAQEFSKKPLFFTSLLPEIDESKYIAVPVPKGSLLLIHGLVMHLSQANRTEHSRHAYAWHVVDLPPGKATWSPDSWLQPVGGDFWDVYETASIVD